MKPKLRHYSGKQVKNRKSKLENRITDNFFQIPQEYNRIDKFSAPMAQGSSFFKPGIRGVKY